MHEKGAFPPLKIKEPIQTDFSCWGLGFDDIIVMGGNAREGLGCHIKKSEIPTFFQDGGRWSTVPNCVSGSIAGAGALGQLYCLADRAGREPGGPA